MQKTPKIHLTHLGANLYSVPLHQLKAALEQTILQKARVLSVSLLPPLSLTDKPSVILVMDTGR